MDKSHLFQATAETWHHLHLEKDRAHMGGGVPPADAQLGKRGGKGEIGQVKGEEEKYRACKFVIVKWEN